MVLKTCLGASVSRIQSYFQLISTTAIHGHHVFSCIQSIGLLKVTQL